MKRLFEIVPGSTGEIKKRAAREYAKGAATKKQFDDVVEACDVIEKISQRCQEIDRKTVMASAG